MINVYTWATPNGTKVVAALEECGLPYRLVPVNLRAKEQATPEFLKISPNGKIPAIVDGDGFVLFESAAILWYIADKTGKLLPKSNSEKHIVNQWMMFQMSAIGPMFGQLHHFKSSAPPTPYALTRFESESRRLLTVLNGRLGESRYLAGDVYTIADVCTWPWIRSWVTTLAMDLDGLQHVIRWYEEIGKRAAIKAAVATYESLKAGANPG